MPVMQEEVVEVVQEVVDAHGGDVGGDAGDTDWRCR
jgi:hypothetical protein